MRDRSPPGDLRHPTADRGMKMQLAWRVRCITLMSVMEIRPAANAYPAQWLLRSDVDWRDPVRYGPPGFEVYVRIAFPQDSGAHAGHRSGEAPVDAVRAALAALGSYTTTPSKGYAAIWEGWVSGAPAPHAARVEIPHGRCCCSPARSKHSETHQLWLGMGLPQAPDKNRTWCGRRIKPGAWPARRSSSPWMVPGRR